MFVKILAVYFIISGLFLLTKGKTLPLILKDFFDHPAVIFLTGVILIFLGTGVFIQNNVSGTPIQNLAKIFGVLVFLKGFIYLFIPKMLAKMPFNKFNRWFGFLGLILMIIGIYLFCVV